MMSKTLTTSHGEATTAGGAAAAAVLSRDEFGVLYAEHFAALCVVARSIVGATDAADVVQQAAIVAGERLERFEPGTDFRAWMAAIVRGVARNWSRGERRRSIHHRAAGRERGAVADASGAAPGDADERVRNALARLGHLEQSCFLLRAGHDYSYRAIGESLGIPEATARSHVYRARRRLIGLLQSQTPSETEAGS